MPARSVVIEKLSKWNGETHADITPGEYTQLTGRAGRRGIDVEGHGVVLWQPGIDPGEVAGLASTRTYPLRSSFRPSYNMAVNLVHQFGRRPPASCWSRRSRSSRPTRRSSGWPGSCARPRRRSTGYAEAADLPPRRLHGVRRAAAPALRRREARRPGPQARRPPRRGRWPRWRRCRPGDVIEVPAGKFAGMRRGARPRAALGATARGPTSLTADRQARRLAMVDFPTPVEAAHPDADARSSFNGRNPQSRRDLASALRDPHPRAAPRRPAGAGGGTRRRVDPDGEREIAGCAPSCRRTRATAAPTARTTPAGPSATSSSSGTPPTLQRRIEQRTNTIARQFDRVCEVLDRAGLPRRTTTSPRPGARLMRHLHRHGPGRRRVPAARALGRPRPPPSWPPSLSALVFEARRPDDASAPRLPGGRVQRGRSPRWCALWADLDALEREHQLDFLREPDLGFAWAAYRWAEGDDLDEVLGEHRPGRRRLRALDQAAARPHRPGGRRRRRLPRCAEAAREAVRRVRRAWWPTRPSTEVADRRPAGRSRSVTARRTSSRRRSGVSGAQAARSAARPAAPGRPYRVAGSVASELAQVEVAGDRPRTRRCASPSRSVARPGPDLRRRRPRGPPADERGTRRRASRRDRVGRSRTIRSSAGRGLVTDAGHAGQAVGGVAAQGGEVGVLARRARRTCRDDRSRSRRARACRPHGAV